MKFTMELTMDEVEILEEVLGEDLCCDEDYVWALKQVLELID